MGASALILLASIPIAVLAWLHYRRVVAAARAVDERMRANLEMQQFILGRLEAFAKLLEQTEIPTPELQAHAESWLAEMAARDDGTMSPLIAETRKLFEDAIRQRLAGQIGQA